MGSLDWPLCFTTTRPQLLCVDTCFQVIIIRCCNFFSSRQVSFYLNTSCVSLHKEQVLIVVKRKTFLDKLASPAATHNQFNQQDHVILQ